MLSFTCCCLRSAPLRLIGENSYGLYVSPCRTLDDCAVDQGEAELRFYDIGHGTVVAITNPPLERYCKAINPLTVANLSFTEHIEDCERMCVQRGTPHPDFSITGFGDVQIVWPRRAATEGYALTSPFRRMTAKLGTERLFLTSL